MKDRKWNSLVMVKPKECTKGHIKVWGARESVVVRRGEKLGEKGLKVVM